MKKHFGELQRIDHNEAITEETHYEFLYHLQSAMLLALREKGTLGIMQHRYAEEKLKQQRRDRVKSIQNRGEYT